MEICVLKDTSIIPSSPRGSLESQNALIVLHKAFCLEPPSYWPPVHASKQLTDSTNVSQAIEALLVLLDLVWMSVDLDEAMRQDGKGYSGKSNESHCFKRTC